MPPVLRSLIKKPGRHPDGQAKGLYFRAVGDGKAYWVFRYRLHGREREMSLGPYPEVKLDEARAKHATLRAQVLNKSDPLAGKRGNAMQPVVGMPTFGRMADLYVETHEADWRNPKHQRQWVMTLTVHAASIRNTPVDQVDTQAILDVLKPLWAKTPETASRLRGRIEVVIDAARALNHIPADRANPARWRGHLDKLLSKPKKLSRGHHKALPYADAPEFVQRLREVQAGNTAALALEFLILTATRTSETLNATWEEIDLPNAVWRISAARMKMKREFSVPLSEPAIAILRVQEAQRGSNPFVFAGRPMRALSSMAMSMLMRRMGVAVTVHGMRSAFRDWAAETGVAFEVAEQCLAHSVGNAVTAAYLEQISSNDAAL